ncbi:hypothetical protein ACUSIJ_08335 [Pseudochelatococcus sp. B33]
MTRCLPLHVLINSAGIMAGPELARDTRGTRCGSRPTTTAISG